MKRFGPWILLLLLLSALLWYFLRPLNSEEAQLAGLPARPVAAPDIELAVNIHRFDQSLWSVRDKDTTAIRALRKQYPFFLPFYAEFLAEIERENNPQWGVGIQDFLKNTYINQLYSDVEKAFPSMEAKKEEYKTAFRFYKKLFPKDAIPDIYTMVTGFKYANTLTDSGLAIGLDLYLGGNYRFYPKVDFIHQYQRRRLSPEFMVPNSIQLLIEDKLGPEPDRDVLSVMIYRGKMLHLMKKILPNTPDSLLTGYTAAQQKWCKEYEGEIWTWLVQNKLLFSQERVHINKVNNDGPFTNGMPRESPGRIGWWVGWRIVEAWLKENPDLSLEEMMAEKDGRKILSSAGYQPKMNPGSGKE